MCTSPVKILNPKLAWTPLDPKYIVVQCNRCFECRARKQQEWFVRSYYEWIRCRMNGGRVFNFTLTFRNEDLPHYEDKRNYIYHRDTEPYYHDGNKYYRTVINRFPSNNVNYEFDCFDQSLTTTFLKLFRQNCQRMFPDKDCSGIKYILCCEYGEHTHRSHLHGNLYVPFALSVRDFRKLICKSWTHGYVGASKKGFLVNSIAALEYTTKYVSKDLYFFDHVLADYLDKENLPTEEYIYRYESVKNYLPKLRVSNGFGSSLCQDVMDKAKDLDWLLRDRPLELPSKNGRMRNFSIPRYVIQKLVKAVDKSLSKALDRPYMVYTDFGNKYRRALFDRKLDQSLSDVRFLVRSLETYKSSNDINFVHCINQFQKLVVDLDPHNLCLYHSFLRYVPVSEYGVHSAKWFFDRSKFILSDYFRRSVIPDISDYLSRCEYTPEDLGISLARGFPLKDFDSSEIVTLSQLSEFQRYESFSRCLDVISIHKSVLRSKKLKQRDDSISRVRSALIEFVLYDQNIILSSTFKI